VRHELGVVLRAFAVRGRSKAEWKSNVAALHPPCPVTSGAWWWRAGYKTAEEVIASRPGRPSYFSDQELNELYEKIIQAQWNGETWLTKDVEDMILNFMRNRPQRFSKVPNKLGGGWWRSFRNTFKGLQVTDTVRIADDRFKSVNTERVAEFSEGVKRVMRGRRWLGFIGYDETGFHGSDLYGRSTQGRSIGAAWLPALNRSAVAFRDHWTALCGVTSFDAPPPPMAFIMPRVTQDNRTRSSSARPRSGRKRPHAPSVARPTTRTFPRRSRTGA
jgi:hypothetical protein